MIEDPRFTTQALPAATDRRRPRPFPDGEERVADALGVECATGSLAELSGWASPAELFRRSRVMVVDDLPTNIQLLERVLKGAGVTEVLGVTDSRLVHSHFQSWQPDLILLDLHMPHMDGIAVLKMLRATIPEGSFLPVLVLTADVTSEAKEAALVAGAMDFLSKPFELAEIILRVQNLLVTRALFLRLRRHMSLDRTLALTRDRERIAQELDDTVIQQLYSAALTLQSLCVSADERVGSRIQSTIDVLDQTMRQLRMTVFALQGPVGQPHGVRARFTTAIAAANDELGFEPRLQFGGPIESIDAATADDLFEVLGEALSNIARHARALAARVEIDVGEDVVLTITDNGAGLADGVPHGRGLSAMCDRAHRLGGDCWITSHTPRGTSVIWRVPAHTSTPPIGGREGQD